MPLPLPPPKVEPFVQITNSLDRVGTQTPTFRAFYRRNPRFAPGLGPEHARLQVVIKSDSYQDQRYGKVLVWSDNSMAWHEVATLATHAYARQVEAAIEAVDLANSAAIAEAARDLPGDRYALRVLVNQARTAYIDLCVKDVIADFGEEGAEAWAGEVECGQHDWNLPLLAQAAARALGCFGHAVPLSLSIWD
jgi:hypothetical protein